MVDNATFEPKQSHLVWLRTLRLTVLIFAPATVACSVVQVSQFIREWFYKYPDIQLVCYGVAIFVAPAALGVIVVTIFQYFSNTAKIGRVLLATVQIVIGTALWIITFLLNYVG